MALSRETDQAILRALSGFLMFRDTIVDELTAASKADNPASALQRLQIAKYDLQLATNRLNDAIERAGREILTDDNRAANDAGLRDLMAALAPYKPRLVGAS